jgi:hypothetical protein
MIIGGYRTCKQVCVNFVSMNQWLASDAQFHKLYPDTVLAQASMHWTPLYIARKAAEFLAAEKNVKY